MGLDKKVRAERNGRRLTHRSIQDVCSGPTSVEQLPIQELSSKPRHLVERSVVKVLPLWKDEAEKRDASASSNRSSSRNTTSTHREAREDDGNTARTIHKDGS